MASSHIDLYKEHVDTGKFIKNENVTYNPIINDNNCIFKSKFNPKLVMTSTSC